MTKRKRIFLTLFVTLFGSLSLFLFSLYLVNLRPLSESSENFGNYETEIRKVLQDYGYDLGDPDIRTDEDEMRYEYKVQIDDDTELRITLENSLKKEYIKLTYYRNIFSSDQAKTNDISLLIDLFNALSRRKISESEMHDFLFNDDNIWHDSSIDDENAELREKSFDFFSRWRGSYFLSPFYQNESTLPTGFLEEIFLSGLI